MRILCFADIGAPLDGPTGRELVRTCAALARRGHEVTMVVRPDVVDPARDPYAVHALDRDGGLRFDVVQLPADAPTPRAGFLDAVVERTPGRDADVIYTRDPGIAVRVLETRRLFRPPLLYDSPGYSPAIAATLPNPPGEEAIRALQRREFKIWQDADAYVGRTVDLIADMTRRFGRRRFATVVSCDGRPNAGAQPAADYVAERIESLVTQVRSANG